MEDLDKKIHTKNCGLCDNKISWIHGDKPEICPHCLAIQWDKPVDECFLFNVQEKWLKTKDKKHLDEMYLRLRSYGTKIARKMLRSKKMDLNTFEDRVQDAVTYFISYYLRKDNFYVTTSFGFQLLKALQQTMYNKKQKNIDTMEMSYNNPISDDLNKTFLDKISEDFEDGNKYDNETINAVNKNFVLDEILEFTDKLFCSIAENRGVDKAVLVMILFHHYFNKKKNDFFELFYSFYGYELKEVFELSKVALIDFLQEYQS